MNFTQFLIITIVKWIRSTLSQTSWLSTCGALKWYSLFCSFVFYVENRASWLDWTGSSSSPINLSCLGSFIDSYPNGKAETSRTGKNFQNTAWFLSSSVVRLFFLFFFSCSDIFIIFLTWPYLFFIFSRSQFIYYECHDFNNTMSQYNRNTSALHLNIS